MIKHYVLLFFILSQSFLSAQQKITGNIINETDVENIHIINMNSKNYAITNEEGVFEIYAKEQDTLSIVSLLHLEKRVVIDEAIISSQKLEIELIKVVNQLDEVVIGNKLTGDLRKDIEQVEIKNLELPKMDYSWQVISNARFEGDREPLRNTITTQGQFVDGINFVAIFRMLSNAIFKKKKEKKQTTIEVKQFSSQYLIAQFGEEIFITILKIPEDQIELFVVYCTSSDSLMLSFNNNNELELLEKVQVLAKEFNALDEKE
ncbi:MAG: hypothetical protein HRT68_11730 [Flavobacteriaceae bacterium]|nr:hypothetical protein [Flavobacteriaceae bacterium]